MSGVNVCVCVCVCVYATLYSRLPFAFELAALYSRATYVLSPPASGREGGVVQRGSEHA